MARTVFSAVPGTKLQKKINLFYRGLGAKPPGERVAANEVGAQGETSPS